MNHRTIIESRLNKGRKILVILCLLATAVFSARAQMEVRDIFGRTLNQRGITLVDWDGYMANPLIKLYVFPPTNALLPASATVTADGGRLYFGEPSSVSRSGPTTAISFTQAGIGVPIYLSIFPAHNDSDGTNTLRLVFTAANNQKQTNQVPIQVIDQDSHRSNDFVVTVNFDRDGTGFFTNATARKLVRQAANDWTYYFTGMNLDPVAPGTEYTYIWSNNFDGGYFFLNTNAYTGYQLYAYGTTNAALRSGGEGDFGAPPQRSGGVPLTIQRSGGFEANIVGNYNTLSWQFLTNDSDWLATDNYGNETNDFFSIAHHEIGHALIFNEAHAGFQTVLDNGGFTSDAVTNYYGGPVPIDSSNDHLTGLIDPESGQGAFGYEYYGNIPRYRWTMTKLDLLCAQEVGYVLRSNSAFAPFDFSGGALPAASVGAAYFHSLIATGGIPIYEWEVVAGDLPPGLALDAFTGALVGSPTAGGNYEFRVGVRDYHEFGDELMADFTLNISGGVAPVSLTITIAGAGSASETQIVLHAAAGQKEIIQFSSDLLAWTPLVTNVLSSNSFQFTETNSLQFPRRFYRAVTVP